MVFALNLDWTRRNLYLAGEVALWPYADYTDNWYRERVQRMHTHVRHRFIFYCCCCFDIEIGCWPPVEHSTSNLSTYTKWTCVCGLIEWLPCYCQFVSHLNYFTYILYTYILVHIFNGTERKKNQTKYEIAHSLTGWRSGWCWFICSEITIKGSENWEHVYRAQRVEYKYNINALIWLN